MIVFKNNKKNKEHKVLVLSTSRYTRGGISAVLKLYEQSEMWEKYHCRWIGTHRDGNPIRKIIYYLYAIVQYILFLPFYDIVHFHISLTNTVTRKYPLFMLARLLGKKTVLHLHCGSQINEVWSSKYQIMFEQCDCAILLSDNLKKIIEKHIGECDKLRVVYNPCPIITSLEKYDKKNQILFSGTLCEGKGYKDLIRAFASVAEKHPDWAVVLAGNGEVMQASSLAKELGISSQVVLLGWISGEEKHKAFSEARVFCLPSYAEGFPMAVLDAWAYGLPVITTPVGGVSDIGVDGKNLLLFNPGDIESLAAKLDIIMNNSDLYHSLSVESMHLASSVFNLETITNQVSSIYENL